MRRFLIVGFCVGLLLISITPVNAYYTGMPASVVIGQTDFVSNSSATTQSTLANTVNFRKLFVDPRGRLIVADEFNSRVLIWNQVPTTNGKPADLVLGQPDFISSTANNGGLSGSSMNKPDAIFSDGNRLVVSDRVNLRVLIWNNFPTNNGQSADVAVGAVDLNTVGQSVCSLTKVAQPTGVWIYNNKLLIGSRQQGRVLIYNTVPTASNASADITVGASNCALASGASDATSSNYHDISDVTVDDQGRLFVVDVLQPRVMVYNSVPTASGQSADYVIGQPDFTTESTGTSADKLNAPTSVSVSGNRVYIADRGNHRVLVYNQIPTVSGMSADIVLGQTSFTAGSANGGGSTSASVFNKPEGVFIYQNKLLVWDSENARVLIFNNILSTPAMNINSPTSVANKIRIAGNVSLGERPNYSMQKVTASVNGENETNVTYLDGGRDNGPGNTLYEFYNDFLPTVRGGDFNNYTIAFRAQSFNAEEDKRFYFTPFTLDKVTIESLPTITFTVNQTFRDQLKNNLIKYQIWYKKTTDKNWQLYIDNISTDSENNGNITIKAKTKLTKGKYQIQVRAINTMNHEQQSNNLNLILKK